MATHSSILAWKIPWTEESGRLQSRGSQRVRHNWATNAWAHARARAHTHTHTVKPDFSEIFMCLQVLLESFLVVVFYRKSTGESPQVIDLCAWDQAQNQVTWSRRLRLLYYPTKLLILHPWKPATGYWKSFQGSPSLTQPSALLPYPSLFLSPSLSHTHTHTHTHFSILTQSIRLYTSIQWRLIAKFSPNSPHCLSWTGFAWTGKNAQNCTEM